MQPVSEKGLVYLIILYYISAILKIMIRTTLRFFYLTAIFEEIIWLCKQLSGDCTTTAK